MILIEREALLTVLSRPPLQSGCDDEDEYVLVNQPKSAESPSLVSKLRPSTSFDDDCCSLTSTVCSDEPRKVSFSGNDNVHIVDRLYQDESLSQHFYSYEDTQRFRSEYRLERKLAAELDVDPSSHEEELSGLFATTDQQGRHHISRVVVLHNDKIKTFGNQADDCFDNDSFWSGSITWY